MHRQPQSLGSFVAGFKRSTTKRINLIRETPSIPVWQRNYDEHIIRNEETWHRLRQYIANNPASWELDQLHPHNPSKWRARSHLPNFQYCKRDRIEEKTRSTKYMS